MATLLMAGALCNPNEDHPTRDSQGREIIKCVEYVHI